MNKIGKIKTIQTVAKRKPAPPVKRRSNISAHDYDPETGHLTVTFHGGRRYRYEGVDRKTAEGLRDAASQGTYLHAHVIGKFDATKLWLDGCGWPRR